MPKPYIKKAKAAPEQPFFFDKEELPAGWELLLKPADKVARYQYTAERLRQDEERYEAVVLALQQGMSARAIENGLNVDRRVVAAVFEREKTRIAPAREQLGEYALALSHELLRELHLALLAGALPAEKMPAAFHYLATNGLLLTGQATGRVEHVAKAVLDVTVWNGFVAVESPANGVTPPAPAALPEAQTGLVLDLQSGATEAEPQ